MAAGDGAGDRAVRVATAVEMVHMATLVHDDVLDGAPVRRGRPTVVARSGRDRAVGVGDLLFSRAFAELAVDGGEAEVAELSSASVALALGELAQRHDAFDTSITEERYLRALLSEDGAALRVRVPARAHLVRARPAPRSSPPSAGRSVSPFSCSTTSST